MNRLISNLILAGLLTTTLPATLPLYGQAPMQGEPLKIEIAKKVKQIKKTVAGLTYAKIAIPSVVIGSGVAIASIVLLTSLIALIKLHRRKKLYKKISKKIKSEIGLLSKNSLEKLKKKISLAIAGVTIGTSISVIVIGAMTSELLGITGITTTLAQKLFGLSTTSVSKASENVKQLEQIEKENRGILTPQQKSVINKFKKMQKGPITKGIIKNLRLKDALEKITNTAIQQHPFLVTLVGKRKVRNYIKLRQKEKRLQKDADQYAAENLSGLQVSSTKRQLKRKKRKIAQLDARYPRLKKTLENAVQTYSAQADLIFEELKTYFMKEVETKTLNLKDLPQQQVVPL